MKIDLSKATFIIPIRIESSDRLRNVITTTAFLLENFDTNILIKEVDSESVFQRDALQILKDILEVDVNVHHIFEKSDKPLFHRQRVLNEMVIEAKTEIVVNYDCDVLLPLDSYHKAYQSILDHTHDIVYPYGQGMYQQRVKTTDEIVSEFLQNTDFAILNKHSNLHTSDFGWAQFFRRQVYIDGGLENENFKAYAPEDKERFYRFTTLGYNVGRINDYVYHLEHARGENSWFSNPHMLSNMEEWEKIQTMNKEQLVEYYSNQKYLKNMIAFNHLGSLGRLGNQMFEYAALRGIAAHHGYEWCIPPSERRGIENYSLHECFKLAPQINEDVKEFQYVQEPHFHFSEKLFEKCPDNVSLYGFFQSEKYFQHISDEIRKDFTFHDKHLGPCKEMIESVEGEPIMLHVRRGDPNLTDPRGFKWSYTQCGDQHPVQPVEYYERALAEFDDDQPVIVFSDSVDWVKEQEFFSGDRFLISEPEQKYADGSFTPYVDLCLMSLCSHAIIANSSMSWWGAWLQSNPNKKVIAPHMWFGPVYADKDTKDLYVDNWIIL